MFYFIHVQGQNALTTLLHLADDTNITRVGNDSDDKITIPKSSRLIGNYKKCHIYDKTWYVPKNFNDGRNSKITRLRFSQIYLPNCVMKYCIMSR